jgi:2-methylcitrate dehydratase
MTALDAMAGFAAGVRLRNVPERAREKLKLHVLDALGCAIGALDGDPMVAVRADADEFRGPPLCSMIGGGRTSPVEAAFVNGALIRYLDFNDSYLAPGETCHPSDNIGAVLAAAQYADAGGDELLAALAVTYQVHCRLSDAAPVRWRHFDHVTTGAYAAAAGASRALGLSPERTANAIAMAGVSLNALRATRTTLSHWKGLAAAFAASGATRAALLARRGVTGPAGVLDGRKGLMETISGPFRIDWDAQDLSAVEGTSIKRFNAEVHSQSAVEAVVALATEHDLQASSVRAIDVDTFDVSYNIIGGGDEGQKLEVGTKEEADHSLPYMVAVALIDRELLPRQYRAERIARDDVQQLIARVRVRPDAGMSRRFPVELPCRVRVTLDDGRVLERRQQDYSGYRTCPMTQDEVCAKFLGLAEPRVSRARCDEIVDCILGLESARCRDLAELLECVGMPAPVAGGTA